MASVDWSRPNGGVPAGRQASPTGRTGRSAPSPTGLPLSRAPLPSSGRAEFRPLAKDLLDATHRRGAAAINARLDLAVDRLTTATGGAREVGPLAAICDALRMAIEPTKAEALP